MGFRNAEEHVAVVGLKLRGVRLSIEPVGRTFRDSAERMAYLRHASKQADYEEAMLRCESKNREYNACQASGGSDRDRNPSANFPTALCEDQSPFSKRSDATLQ